MKRKKWWIGLGGLAFLLAGLMLFFVRITRPAEPVAPLFPRPQVQKGLFTIAGVPTTVYAIPTGTIQIKSCHHTGCLSEDTPYLLRFLRILTDRTFVEPMPIWTYLIEHPEGRYLIDTGGVADWEAEESWSCDPETGRVARSMARVQVLAGEALMERLAALGLTSAEIEAAIITHAHFDHTGGIRPLGVPTYMGAGDLAAAQEIGSVPCRFFEGADLRPVEAASISTQSGVETPVLSLTEDQTLQLFATGGHTPGSLMVRLRTDQTDLWFVGDITFEVAGIAAGAPTAGIHTDMKQIRRLHQVFRAMENATLLPAHASTIQLNSPK